MKKKLFTLCGRWKKQFDYSFTTRTFFTLTSDLFVVRLSGGSVCVSERQSGNSFSRKGFNYLYTADVKPDESELFALENGKHFYVFSLPDLSSCRKLTLPRGWEACDVYGEYSADGKTLTVPVYRFRQGPEYSLCTYETQGYSLLGMQKTKKRVFGWPGP